jgi:hypothetical protein
VRARLALCAHSSLRCPYLDGRRQQVLLSNGGCILLLLLLQRARRPAHCAPHATLMCSSSSGDGRHEMVRAIVVSAWKQQAKAAAAGERLAVELTLVVEDVHGSQRRAGAVCRSAICM